jgi:hypothetical protein
MLRYPGSEQVRTLRSVTWPRIEFSYRLLEAGTEIAAGTAEVNDKNYLNNLLLRARLSYDPVPYEAVMLERWFAEHFAVEAGQAASGV